MAASMDRGTDGDDLELSLLPPSPPSPGRAVARSDQRAGSDPASGARSSTLMRSDGAGRPGAAMRVRTVLDPAWLLSNLSGTYSVTSGDVMSVRHGLLALLSEQPMHAYQLKQQFEERTGGT